IRWIGRSSNAGYQPAGARATSPRRQVAGAPAAKLAALPEQRQARQIEPLADHAPQVRFFGARSRLLIECSGVAQRLGDLVANLSNVPRRSGHPALQHLALQFNEALLDPRNALLTAESPYTFGECGAGWRRLQPLRQLLQHHLRCALRSLFDSANVEIPPLIPQLLHRMAAIRKAGDHFSPAARLVFLEHAIDRLDDHRK